MRGAVDNGGGGGLNEAMLMEPREIEGLDARMGSSALRFGGAENFAVRGVAIGGTLIELMSSSTLR